MPRPQIDLARKVKDILQHVHELPKESITPLSHYLRTSNDLWNSILYVERVFNQPGRYNKVAERHFARLSSMILVNLIENFERFLKETAANCVDNLADFVLDDRLNIFTIQGGTLASHYATGSLGKSLCESGTWLNCDEINSRFRKLLSDHFQQGKNSFNLFPNSNQKPENERWRYPVMALIWQIRHSIVHNVGVITQSDAVKLRLLAREHVQSPKILAPDRNDLRYLKQFLDETAESCNKRVGVRLAELMSEILNDTPGLFDPQQRADLLTESFRFVLTVGGKSGNLPP